MKLRPSLLGFAATAFLAACASAPRMEARVEGPTVKRAERKLASTINVRATANVGEGYEVAMCAIDRALRHLFVIGHMNKEEATSSLKFAAGAVQELPDVYTHHRQTLDGETFNILNHSKQRLIYAYQQVENALVIEAESDEIRNNFIGPALADLEYSARRGNFTVNRYTWCQTGEGTPPDW